MFLQKVFQFTFLKTIHLYRALAGALPCVKCFTHISFKLPKNPMRKVLLLFPMLNEEAEA